MTAKRRPKGSGSIYVLKDGTVVGRYEVETPSGETKRKYVRGKTKREVAAKSAKAIAERDAGIVYDSEGLTVERYLVEHWLESIRDKVRPGTYKPYEAIVRLHVIPTLGNTKLEKLTALQLEKLYRQKFMEGLSARRVRYIHVTIRKALKDAVRLQRLPRNVADAAIPPQASKRKIKPLTQEQLRTLLDAAKGDKLEALYVLAITTGMRQGELLGLQWKDIDLDEGTLTVNRSVYDGEINPPKTEAGNRTIRLSKLAIAALRQHRLNAARQRISEWVFPNSKGESGARLLIIDPLSAFMRGDPNKDSDVRKALTPLAKMAEHKGVAVLVVRHFNKNIDTRALYRGGGSIGIIGAARSALVVVQHPDDDELRVLVPQKSNLSKKAQSLAYTTGTAENGAARVEWKGTVDLDAEELLTTDKSEEARAKLWITDRLNDGPLPSSEIEAAAKEAGISISTLKRAKSKLPVVSKKDGPNGEWRWHLVQEVQEGQGCQEDQEAQQVQESQDGHKGTESDCECEGRGCLICLTQPLPIYDT
jgi:integrase